MSNLLNLTRRFDPKLRSRASYEEMERRIRILENQNARLLRIIQRQQTPVAGAAPPEPKPVIN